MVVNGKAFKKIRALAVIVALLFFGVIMVSASITVVLSRTPILGLIALILGVILIVLGISGASRLNHIYERDNLKRREAEG